MPATAADLYRSLEAISDRIRGAALRTLEAHRPWNPEGISLDCVRDFLRRLDTVACDDFVAEALSERLDAIERSVIADLANKGDDAEIGRMVRRAIHKHADAVLASHAGEADRYA